MDALGNSIVDLVSPEPARNALQRGAGDDDGVGSRGRRRSARAAGSFGSCISETPSPGAPSQGTDERGVCSSRAEAPERCAGMSARVVGQVAFDPGMDGKDDLPASAAGRRCEVGAQATVSSLSGTSLAGEDLPLWQRLERKIAREKEEAAVEEAERELPLWQRLENRRSRALRGDSQPHSDDDALGLQTSKPRDRGGDADEDDEDEDIFLPRESAKQGACVADGASRDQEDSGDEDIFRPRRHDGSGACARVDETTDDRRRQKPGRRGGKSQAGGGSKKSGAGRTEGEGARGRGQGKMTVTGGEGNLAGREGSGMERYEQMGVADLRKVLYAASAA